jgi:phosphatidate cytidylyltransferase
VALVLAPIVLLAAWAGGRAMLALGLVAVLISLHELYSMARGLRPVPLTGYAGGAGIVVVSHTSGLDWSVAVLLGTVVATFLIAAAVSARESALVTVAVTTFGVVWIGFGVAFLVLLRDVPGPHHFGFNLLLATLLATWASDIFAYFGGRLVGRHRLAPAISPNKTVEGLLIGLAAGTFTGWVTLYDQGLSSLDAFWVGLAIAVAGPIGDLFESFVKRDLGVKDSGTLLPGHGGLLDRVDALLFAGAAAYFVVLAMGRA